MDAAFKLFEKKINALQDSDENGESGFAKEFQALRQTSAKYKAKGNTTYATKAGETAVNKPKNRFKDILPFDYSRVTLPSTGVDGSDYINANFVKGVHGDNVYIASQGPLPNTVNDFWRMLWTHKVKVVVMLCREEENGKKKCQRYWCENNEDKLNFGEIVVKTERCIGVGNDFTMRTLVAEMQGEKLTLTQFHYTAWPDHGVPTTALPLIHLIKLLREYQPEDSPPIVLHCSAGCGRTGTICALDYTRSLLKENMYNDLNPYRIVESLRKQRHAMVQTKGQYEFMCRAMCCLFREKLDLPIEEDHDDHLYENVVPVTPSSDSDSDVTPASPIVMDKTSHPTNKKENNTTKKIEHKNKPGGVSQSASSHSGPNQKRVGQISPQSPSENYVNVAFDLIDLSDEPTPPHKPAVGKPNNVSSQDDVFKSRTPKAPVVRKTSSPDYAVVDKSRHNSDDSSDYVIVPPKDRGGNHGYTGGSRSLPTPGSGYENVQPPAPPTRPTTNTRPAISTKPTLMALSTSSSNTSTGYENVEVPGRRTPTQTSTFPPRDRAGRPTTPEKGPHPKEIRRSASTTSDLDSHKPTHVPKKAITAGPHTGAKLAQKLKMLDGKRARVLPNESVDVAEADKKIAKETGAENASSLYASVDRSGRSSRRQVNEETFKRADVVDGQKTWPISKKPEVLSLDEQESNNDSRTKSKVSSLTNKKSMMPFLSKRPEVRGTVLGDIGYGKRVGKPKGPRSPPQSWMVKS